MAKETTKLLTLSNGLTLLGEPNPLHQSAAIGFFVRTGARDETKKEAGVSHFLEHMMFKGTPKRTALELTYELGNIGAQSNAFTSEEMTVYYASIIPEHFASMQEILSDMLRPSLDPLEFDTEKKVILEEIALYQDRPHYFLYEKAIELYFEGHTAGNSVLGSTESVGGLSQAEMKDYFDRRYAPGNMILAASGKFDWDSFVRDAEKYCGGWAPFPVSRDLRPHTYKQKKVEFKRKNSIQAHSLFISPSCSAQDEERYALSLLGSIIGDSSGSRLYWELIDTGIAESVGADLDEKDGVGCFTVSSSVEPSKVAEVEDVIRRIISTPLDFKEEDLERAKKKVISRIVLSGELPMGRLMSLGSEWTYRKRMHSLSQSIESYKKVTRGAIEAALQKFPIENWSEFRLVPE